MTTQSRRGRSLLAFAAAVAVSVVSLAPPTATASTVRPDTRRSGVYLIALRPAPLASYGGHLPGLKATAPRSGERLRSRTPAARAYTRHLAAGRSRVLAALGRPEVLYTYAAALNGFAARLSTDQAALAASLPGVASVTASSKARLDSINRGLSATPPPTARPAATPAGNVSGPRGQGTVIGVIDSGIWPENPSFAGVPLRRADVRRTYPGFGGSCGSGEDWSDDRCNAKVIAARHFVKGFGAASLSAADFLSPRDGTGHGSHTAATAAGNAGVDVTIDGQDFGRISGAAPEAALSVYKACWTAPDPRDDGCTTADTVAAIDAAVRDGVDVISYSIGAGDTAATSLVDQAFRNAARAGIFIAASAGDDGPRPSTVAGHGPWVTTVAATSGHRFEGTVVLGNGDTYAGSMASHRAVGRAPLVAGADARAAGASPLEARRCYPAALDARHVHGAVVVCERGGTARVSKSVTVEDAGGAAMVLVNAAAGSTEADVHAVPSVHLAADAGAKVRSYIATASRPTAAVHPSGDAGSPGVTVADFSSRGPDPASSGNLLKPDIAAPGVAVVSAVAPASNAGRLWDLASGTSMAAPQVAGFAAVVMSAHRDWSPAAVKSALVTTARPLDAGGPLASGAGSAHLRGALDPGLVYDGSGTTWSNPPSVALGALVARTTTTRRLTNVGSRTQTYVARLSGLPGLSASVVPASLTLAPGQSRTFSVTLSARRTARYDRFVSGALTWSGAGGHQVTSPVVVRPRYVEAARDVSGSGSRGALTLRSRAGVTGRISTTVVGPVPAQPRTVSLQAGRLDPRLPPRASAAWSRRYVVAEGTAAVRFEVTSPRGHDVDLTVFRDGKPVASADTPAAHEKVTLSEPDPGNYDVFVHAATAGKPSDLAGRSAAVSARFTGWVLPEIARNPAVSAPRRVEVTGGRVFAVALRWSSLDPSRRWFGQLRYQHSTMSVSSFTVN